MTSQSLVSPGGIVTIGDRTFMTRKLSVAREVQLENHLIREAKKAQGPGGAFARMAPVLDWLRENKRAGEWQVAVETLTRLEGSGAAPAQAVIEEFRQSPKGVAIELWHRTRQDHQEVELRELEAVITEANGLDVYLQIVEAITDSGKAPAPSGSPAS